MNIEVEPKSVGIFPIKKDTLVEWQKGDTVDMTFLQTREQIVDQFKADPAFARVLSSIIGLRLYKEYTTPGGLNYITPTISEQAIDEMPYGTLAFLQGVGSALKLTSLNSKNRQMYISPDIVKTLEGDHCELVSVVNNLRIKQEKWHTIEMAIREVIRATPNLGTNMDILEIGLKKILINKGYQLTSEETEDVRKFLLARNKILLIIDEPKYPLYLSRIQGLQQDEEIDSQRLRYKDPYFVEAMEQNIGRKSPIKDMNTMAGWIAVHEMYGSDHQLII